MEFERAAEKLTQIIEANARAVYGPEGKSAIAPRIEPGSFGRAPKLLLHLDATMPEQKKEYGSLYSLLFDNGIRPTESHTSNANRMEQAWGIRPGYVPENEDKRTLIFNLEEIYRDYKSRTDVIVDSGLEAGLEAILNKLQPPSAVEGRLIEVTGQEVASEQKRP